jgi:lysozyme
MNKMLEQLKKHEGFRGDVYQCTAGANTIGYGHNLDANPIKISEYEAMGLSIEHDFIKTPMTKEQASILLELDLKKYIHAVDTSFPDITQLLNDPRKAVLYNMAFNLGMTRLRKFNKMFSAILQGNFIKASIEMLDSAWAKQVGHRANELSLQMKTGEWS